jgi:hypothetical protein
MCLTLEQFRRQANFDPDVTILRNLIFCMLASGTPRTLIMHEFSLRVELWRALGPRVPAPAFGCCRSDSVRSRRTVHQTVKSHPPRSSPNGLCFNFQRRSNYWPCTRYTFLRLLEEEMRQFICLVNNMQKVPLSFTLRILLEILSF